MIFCLAAFVFLLGMQTQPQEVPVISSPLSGSAVQGSVTISGNTDLTNFRSAEVSFSYLSGSTRNWFLIQQNSQPVKGGTLAIWDTTTIADGNYALRLQVFLKSGQIAETTLSELRVRNYTAIETNTPANPNQRPVGVTPQTPSPVLLTATPRFTPSPLAPNPVQVQPESLTASLGWGIGLTIAFFIILALYQAAHHRGN